MAKYRTIWKFPFDLQNKFTLDLPRGATILDVQPVPPPRTPIPGRDYDPLCIWAIVDRQQPLVKRAFLLMGTGHDFEPKGDYVGTFQENGFVWHVFDLGEAGA